MSALLSSALTIDASRVELVAFIGDRVGYGVVVDGRVVMESPHRSIAEAYADTVRGSDGLG